MKSFIPRLKQVSVWVWIALTAALVVVVWLVWRPFRRKGGFGDGPLSEVATATRDRLTEANAIAAVEIAQARHEDLAVRSELASIRLEPDRKKRLARLVLLRRRIPE